MIVSTKVFYGNNHGFCQNIKYKELYAIKLKYIVGKEKTLGLSSHYIMHVI